ncbi:unnamed protein product, partial [Mesorhabditis spiculigera]
MLVSTLDDVSEKSSESESDEDDDDDDDDSDDSSPNLHLSESDAEEEVLSAKGLPPIKTGPLIGRQPKNPTPPSKSSSTLSQNGAASSPKAQLQQVRNDEALAELRKKLRTAEIRYEETVERLTAIRHEYDILNKEHSRLLGRWKNREVAPHTGVAVAVLSDKLQAKDREISQLKSRISQLEREMSD